MFLKTEQIRESLEPLKYLHPFYGITFLVCKKAPLPIGDTIQYPINARETEFLEEYFKPEQDSKYGSPNIMVQNVCMCYILGALGAPLHIGHIAYVLS